ncbi:hypothetical protein SAMN04488581_3767 [Mycolicibacterium neoaurum]|uniref:hypothetical protein n=1 Tax=Mycolicibacterium neoaurum TaxID=1795 RepID=UPI0005645660|nr:hypothetical protein [Mycolicibacterium neoaurum]SDE28398.1 hypothetical protein SAMN04488581_3767 [Mycolicibacterium neoaurum]
MSGKFEINKTALKKIEKDVNKRLPGVQVPLEGTEADAIRSVKDQLKKMGATPNDSAVRKLVHEARGS